jgi:hypothetical protein
VNSARDSLIVGEVRDDVASIAVHLPGGGIVRLTPVQLDGNRWVGLVLPARVPITRAVAYSADGSEIGYSVPFGDQAPAVWWAPGQAVPARVTKTIGSGVVSGTRWHVTADIGPWGYCYRAEPSDSLSCSSSPSNPGIVPTGTVVSGDVCFGTGQSSMTVGIGFAATSVRTVVVEYSSKSSASFPVVSVSGGRVFAYVVPPHRKVTGSREYGPAGRLVARAPASSFPSC